MYGKDFHQWREAQEIIRRIEAEEPEVRDMVRKRYMETQIAAFPNLTRQMPIQAQLLQQQLERQRRGTGIAPLGGLFGCLFS